MHCKNGQCICTTKDYCLLLEHHRVVTANADCFLLLLVLKHHAATSTWCNPTYRYANLGLLRFPRKQMMDRAECILPSVAMLSTQALYSSSVMPYWGFMNTGC